jgi:orotate phosphoribosyltransferase
VQDYRAALVTEERMTPAASDGGLSAGALAGIAVAGVMLLAVLCAAALFVVRQRGKHGDESEVRLQSSVTGRYMV